MRVQHHKTVYQYILLVFCVSNVFLALPPQLMVYSGYLPETYSCGIKNSLSYGVSWSQAFFDVDYIVNPFPEHNLILEAWYRVSDALLQLLLSE